MHRFWHTTPAMVLAVDVRVLLDWDSEVAKLVGRGEAEDDAHAQSVCIVGQIREAFQEPDVHDWEGLEGTYGLPDPGDEHVVASAVWEVPERSLPLSSRTSLVNAYRVAIKDPNDQSMRFAT